jgi:hypothetical protein
MSKGIPHYVLHHVAQGQDWPEGDATFHRRILAPTLLVHGLQDPYVTLVQECEMERVSGLVDRRSLYLYEVFLSYVKDIVCFDMQGGTKCDVAPTQRCCDQRTLLYAFVITRHLKFLHFQKNFVIGHT